LLWPNLRRMRKRVRVFPYRAQSLHTTRDRLPFARDPVLSGRGGLILCSFACPVKRNVQIGRITPRHRPLRREAHGISAGDPGRSQGNFHHCAELAPKGLIARIDGDHLITQAYISSTVHSEVRNSTRCAQADRFCHLRKMHSRVQSLSKVKNPGHESFRRRLSSL
jgi:hypothetical protein